MQHEITINGFEFTIEIIDTGRWNKEDEMFECVQWKVVDGLDCEPDDFADDKEWLFYCDSCSIVNPDITFRWSDEMEDAIQEACKKCTN